MTFHGVFLTEPSKLNRFKFAKYHLRINQVTAHLKRCNPAACQIKDRKHWKSRTKTSTDDYKQTEVFKFKLQSRALQIKFKKIIRVQQAVKFK